MLEHSQMSTPVDKDNVQNLPDSDLIQRFSVVFPDSLDRVESARYEHQLILDEALRRGNLLDALCEIQEAQNNAAIIE